MAGFSESKAVESFEMGMQQQEHEPEEVGVIENVYGLKRRLNRRQVDMIAIGGSIGTALFISIGYGLIEGGPGSLFISFCIYSCFLACVNNCMAEMSTFMPVSGGFIRMGSKWVDEAFGFMLGWNFFLYEAAAIPYEISALSLVLTFWTDKIPIVAICIACIVLYAMINLFTVKWYGEAEFWLSTGKVILIALLFAVTITTMCGANPRHDAYGFRYWKNPGAFAPYLNTGDLGRFEGFLAAYFLAAFVVVGPEYMAMVAGETANPRKTIKRAFKTVYLRFGIFFIGGALCVGIVVPWNDPTLNGVLEGTIAGAGTGAASPYVVAIQNLGISTLPSIVNALILTSIFSAGNTLTYCATRALHGLAMDGHAPSILKHCTKSGVPIYCFGITMLFPLLSLLAIRTSTSQVIVWLANLTQASQVIDYICMCTIYLFFYRALKVQGVDRKTLPYVGWWQPLCGWVGLVTMTITVVIYGYSVFMPGYWSVGTFFSFYTMIFLCIVLYAFWKVFKRTKIVKAHEADLIWERPIIDAYEAAYVEPNLTFFQETLHNLGLRKRPQDHIL